MQDKVSPPNLALKYVYLSQIRVRSATPDCSAPDHADPNQGLHHQIMRDLPSSEILQIFRTTYLSQL